MESTPYPPYLYLVVLLGVAILFPLVPLWLSQLWFRTFGVAKPGKEKNAVYECGLASKGVGKVSFHANYYVYGLLFLLFDVEVVFLYPFAAAFLELSLGSFIGMMVFVLLLVEGLAWAWMRGLFEPT